MINNKEKVKKVLGAIFQIERKLGDAMSPIAFVRFAKTHDYINYCEGIIARNGYVYRMNGSHTQMLMKLLAKTHDKSLTEIYEEIPRTYWLDMEYYGLKLTKAIALHYEFQQGASTPSKKQLATLDLLERNGLIVKHYERLSY